MVDELQQFGREPYGSVPAVELDSDGVVVGDLDDDLDARDRCGGLAVDGPGQPG
jgi:hypothetical protein